MAASSTDEKRKTRLFVVPENWTDKERDEFLDN
jgi:hypothetical protein